MDEVREALNAGASVSDADEDGRTGQRRTPEFFLFRILFRLLPFNCCNLGVTAVLE